MEGCYVAVCGFRWELLCRMMACRYDNSVNEVLSETACFLPVTTACKYLGRREDRLQYLSVGQSVIECNSVELIAA